MIIILEGLVMCLVLLLICIVGMANGCVGLVVFYEKDVQQRAVELGLVTREQIKRSSIITMLALFIPVLFAVPAMVYGYNGAENYLSGFWQMTAIYLIMGLFDRLFIDLYWVGHTKAWIIPGTEDLMPYIPVKTVVKKWIGTLVGFPLTAAAIAGIMTLIIG